MNNSFLKHLETFGATHGFVCNGVKQSYSTLSASIKREKSFIANFGLPRGAVVALEGRYTPSNCALLIALIECGAIIVPLPAGPQAKRAEFIKIAEVEYIITSGEVTESTIAATGRAAQHELYGRLRQSNAPGLVLFSSGTTGQSKASVLNFNKFLKSYDTTKLRPRRTLAFLSLDHIGGINTLMHTLVHGGCLVTTEERTPRSVFGSIAAYGVDTLPTTPTFLTMCLISGELTKHDLSSLRLVTYGTEPMPIQTLRKLNEVLPQARLKQTYGLSEVGILPTRSKGNDSLWIKLGNDGFDYKIIDNILWIRSDMAMLGYLNAAAAFDDEGYFNTQDVVSVDGDYLHILGRKSEIINVGGEKVYPNEVESILLEIENIAEATVSGKPNPITGMIVKAVVRLVEPEPSALVMTRIRSHCQKKLERYKIPAIIEISDKPQHSDRHKKIRVAS